MDSPKRGLFARRQTHNFRAGSGYSLTPVRLLQSQSLIKKGLPVLFSSLPHPSRPVQRQPPTTMSNAELACSYASLILADEGIEITVCIPSFIPLGPEDDGGIFGRLEMSRK